MNILDFESTLVVLTFILWTILVFTATMATSTFGEDEVIWKRIANIFGIGFILVFIIDIIFFNFTK